MDRSWDKLSEPLCLRTPFAFAKGSSQNKASLLVCLPEQCLVHLAIRTAVGFNDSERRGRREPRSDDNKRMFGRRQRESLEKNRLPNFGKHTDVPDSAGGCMHPC